VPGRCGCGRGASAESGESDMGASWA